MLSAGGEIPQAKMAKKVEKRRRGEEQRNQAA
jgi:hypothetical protein